MNGYIYSVVCIAAACGITLALTGERIKKHVKLVCSLCLLCVMINPVFSLINGLKEIFDEDISGIVGEDGEKNELRENYESIFDSYLEGGYGNNVGQAVKDCLYEKYGIPKEECRVMVEFTDKNSDGVREPSRITVVLSKGSVFRDPSEIKSFIEGLFECACRCAIE